MGIRQQGGEGALAAVALPVLPQREAVVAETVLAVLLLPSTAVAGALLVLPQRADVAAAICSPPTSAVIQSAP